MHGRLFLFTLASFAAVLGTTGCKSCNKDQGAGGDAAASATAALSARLPGSAEPPRFAAPLQQACYAVAKARCNRIGQCGMMNLAVAEGLFTSCLTRARNECMLDRPANEPVPPPTLDACAKSYADMSCTELMSGERPKECRIAGSAEDGKACVTDGQCASSFCARAGTPDGCGKCEAAPRDGDDCKQDHCAAGLRCSEKKCVKPKAPGLLKLGVACDPSASACDRGNLLYCDPASKTCKQLLPAKSSESCGPDVHERVCPGDSTCREGKCVKLLGHREACTPETAALCMAPTHCIGATCKLPDAAMCPK